ncbi:hypothetical protein K2173_010497 [Erythroxylum novogranatense]|uniref:Pentatricopeptide repeat-containing protein n=1 Tax=Erythroxylum novogranatense TaxID=1862640 RepID=A0AAV8TFJ0_9ROSI|nr:hypothetical protein K2173_010497 [Erythroxylum novogranatense]
MPLSTLPKSAALSKFSTDYKKKTRSSGLPCIAQSVVNLASQGQLSQAVSSLELLSRKGIVLPTRILAFLVKQCATIRSLKLGKWLHLHLKIIGRIRRPNTSLANSLIHMYFQCNDYRSAWKVFDELRVRNLYTWNYMLSGYAKLGMIKPARRLFDKMPERDVVSWNTMIIAYAQNGGCGQSLKIYRELRRSGIGYNAYSFAGLLTVCVNLKGLVLSRQAHGQVLVAGFLSNLVISSSLVDAYSKCWEMDGARRLFNEMNVKDVLTWTTMVSGYVQSGNIEAASEIFDLMPEKNPVSWTALISGYVRHGLAHKALDLFTKMMTFRIPPDQFTFSSCLCACATISSLRHGKQLHGYLLRMNFRPNTIVVSSLIDMYSKCGCLNVGRLVFDRTGNKLDLILWNTIISALAQHGHGKEAIQMFDDMLRSDLKPDKTTLVVILNACSHSGLVQEGLSLFKTMTQKNGLIPNQEHYACLIDLLSRAGCSEELMNQLEKMPCEPHDGIGYALIGVSRFHGNIELGGKTAEHLIQTEPRCSGPSNVYASLGKWELVEKVRHLKNERQALSWIEIDKKIHVFTVPDLLDPMKEPLYTLLKFLASHMDEVSSPKAEF